MTGMSARQLTSNFVLLPTFSSLLISAVSRSSYRSLTDHLDTNTTILSLYHHLLQVLLSTSSCSITVSNYLNPSNLRNISSTQALVGLGDSPPSYSPWSLSSHAQYLPLTPLTSASSMSISERSSTFHTSASLGIMFSKAIVTFGPISHARSRHLR